MPHIGPYYHKKPGFKRIGAWGYNSELLWSKITKLTDTECWPWQGAMSPTGALMGAWKDEQQQMTQARRLVWMDVYNEDVTPYQIKLTCRNQKCCNPQHLEARPSNRKNTLEPQVKDKPILKLRRDQWWG